MYSQTGWNQSWSLAILRLYVVSLSLFRKITDEYLQIGLIIKHKGSTLLIRKPITGNVNSCIIFVRSIWILFSHLHLDVSICLPYLTHHDHWTVNLHLEHTPCTAVSTWRLQVHSQVSGHTLETQRRNRGTHRGKAGCHCPLPCAGHGSELRTEQKHNHSIITETLNFILCILT